MVPPLQHPPKHPSPAAFGPPRTHAPVISRSCTRVPCSSLQAALASSMSKNSMKQKLFLRLHRCTCVPGAAAGSRRQPCAGFGDMGIPRRGHPLALLTPPAPREAASGGCMPHQHLPPPFSCHTPAHECMSTNLDPPKGFKGALQVGGAGAPGVKPGDEERGVWRRRFAATLLLGLDVAVLFGKLDAQAAVAVAPLASSGVGEGGAGLEPLWVRRREPRAGCHPWLSPTRGRPWPRTAAQARAPMASHCNAAAPCASQVQIQLRVTTRWAAWPRRTHPGP